jgi:hypothetical protein
MAVIRIYVDDHCAGCKRAEELVDRARGVYPDVDAMTINIDGAVDLPDSLFALPTWYVDGKIWMLGNPSWDQLHRLVLRDEARESRPTDK